LSAGINPGYAFDLWPTLMSQLSRRIDLLVCSEYCDMQSYTSNSAMAFMGFGLPPEARPPIEDAHADPYRSAYYASLFLLGDAVGVEFDNVTFRREVAVSPVETATPAGVYSPGTVVASRLVFTGHVAGVPRIEFRVIWRVSDVAAPEWGTGDGIWTIDIEGDPNVRCRLEVETPTDSGRSVSIATAMVPLNAIPSVVAARPGFVSHIDLGLHAGGYVSTASW
jgi:4-hydroxy-tetrahydrodipicolinate reductase